ncbi:ferritin-like domain-containing protein [Sorangium cellulosum]|uniref:ferritin-like domain-containing protein n=1 Tax=Sorangium cellulosum TaxID=56 RepID=UPI003D9A8DCD
MQRKFAKFLVDLPRAPKEDLPPDLGKPDGFGWRDYLLMLLQVDVGIEHALMVQYLYAAYSLGGKRVPSKKREMVRRWQQTILSIAKEEMGHLLTVQNVITCMGGSVYLDRENFPWDHEFYPFSFELEPLTLESLSKYVYAEAPVDWKDDLGDKIRKVDDWPEICRRAFGARIKGRAKAWGRADGERPHDVRSVAALFRVILAIVKHPSRITDAEFFAETFSQQAGWDAWACNQGNLSGEDAPDPLSTGERQPHKATRPTTADVLVVRVATRDDVIDALEQIAEQGEAARSWQERSHFARFHAIYREFKHHFPEGSHARPARGLPVNPTTFKPVLRENGDTAMRCTYIDNPVARQWATLFDLRYRLLLTYLTHSFRLARSVDPNKGPSKYQAVMHQAFCEMYNLKALSEILIRQPLKEGVLRSKNFEPAGPTFQMPYTLELPENAVSCWLQYKDILGACAEMRTSLGSQGDSSATPQEKDFLAAMADADRKCQAWLDAVLKAASVCEQVR